MLNGKIVILEVLCYRLEWNWYNI